LGARDASYAPNAGAPIARRVRALPSSRVRRTRTGSRQLSGSGARVARVRPRDAAAPWRSIPAMQQPRRAAATRRSSQAAQPSGAARGAATHCSPALQPRGAATRCSHAAQPRGAFTRTSRPVQQPRGAAATRRARGAPTRGSPPGHLTRRSRHQEGRRDLRRCARRRDQTPQRPPVSELRRGSAQRGGRGGRRGHTHLPASARAPEGDREAESARASIRAGPRPRRVSAHSGGRGQPAENRARGRKGSAAPCRAETSESTRGAPPHRCGPHRSPQFTAARVGV